jgi:hypothetical protein
LEGSKCGYGGQLPKDDFGYWIDTKSRRGFLSSNRAGGQGYDDIYKFLETKNFFANKNYMEK